MTVFAVVVVVGIEAADLQGGEVFREESVLQLLLLAGR